MLQRVLLGVPPDVGQQMRADEEARPAAEQDALGQEEVDQVAQRGAQALGGLVEERDRDRVGFDPGGG